MSFRAKPPGVAQKRKVADESAPPDADQQLTSPQADTDQNEIARIGKSLLKRNKNLSLGGNCRCMVICSA
jgi:hypothetical protein